MGYYGLECSPGEVWNALNSGFHMALLDTVDSLDPKVASNVILKLCPPQIADILEYISAHVTPGIRYFLLDIPYLIEMEPTPENVAQFDVIASKILGVSLLVPLNNNPRWWHWWSCLRSSGIGLSLRQESDSYDFRWNSELVQVLLIPKFKITHSAKLIESFAEATIILSHISHLKPAKILAPPNPNILIDPLQPLRDNLPLDIYTQFELDENKYNQYEKAMELAIQDLAPLYECIKVLVVGPGQGKLIDKLLNVSRGYKISVMAIEKNSKCIELLKEKSRFWPNVEIVHGDIRDFRLSPHLVISELLGSFGDNELCPEILADLSTNKSVKIMIPTSYTNFLQPVYTPILDQVPLRPYLCNLTKFIPLDKVQPGWSYDHPSAYSSEVSKTFTFVAQHSFKINCFFGYFESNLYGHFNISISKDAHNEEHCDSWYPIMFPVEVIDVVEGEEIVFRISRRSDDTKVWYEWSYKDQEYNTGGDQYFMSLT